MSRDMAKMVAMLSQVAPKKAAPSSRVVRTAPVTPEQRAKQEAAQRTANAARALTTKALGAQLAGLSHTDLEEYADRPRSPFKVVPAPEPFDSVRAMGALAKMRKGGR